MHVADGGHCVPQRRSPVAKSQRHTLPIGDSTLHGARLPLREHSAQIAGEWSSIVARKATTKKARRESSTFVDGSKHLVAIKISGAVDERTKGWAS